ncbi:MAG: hypothetical protein DRO87_12635 [Candidatus Thorarchaeota archaeon]|nr:MAG: hypothetical protein DRO87_12635 [Candidatus Thorarchaeota archaeon]
MKCFVCGKETDTSKVGGKDVCDSCEVETFTQENLCLVTYAAVREAQGDEPFHIDTQCQTEANALAAAINQGIDSRLQAVSCQDKVRAMMIGDKVAGMRLHLDITPDTLPVLIRRLFEGSGMDEETFDAAESLASGIMTSLGFDECGRFVGREALGLE